MASVIGQLIVDRTGDDALDDGDRDAMVTKLASAISGVVSSGVYAVAGGTGNAITVSPSPAFPGYSAGQEINVLITNANTGAVTINVSGAGVRDVRALGGTALDSGALVVGQVAKLVYDGTRFLLVNAAFAPTPAPGR